MSVSMIARISDSTSSASRFGSSRAGRSTKRRQKAYSTASVTASSIASLKAANGPPKAAGKTKVLVIADGDELQLAQQQRHEAQEDDRVHQAGTPFALQHALLQQAVDQHAARALPGLVPADFGLQRQHDLQLAPRQGRKAGKGQQHQQGDSERAHRCAHSRHCACPPPLTQVKQAVLGTPRTGPTPEQSRPRLI